MLTRAGRDDDDEPFVTGRTMIGYCIVRLEGLSCYRRDNVTR